MEVLDRKLLDPEYDGSTINPDCNLRNKRDSTLLHWSHQKFSTFLLKIQQSLELYISYQFTVPSSVPGLVKLNFGYIFATKTLYVYSSCKVFLKTWRTFDNKFSSGSILSCLVSGRTRVFIRVRMLNIADGQRLFTDLILVIYWYSLNSTRPCKLRWGKTAGITSQGYWRTIYDLHSAAYCDCQRTYCIPGHRFRGPLYGGLAII